MAATRKQILVTIGCVCAGVAITWLAIALTGRSASDASSEQRQWDSAHHDQIIALKSEAESLAIDGKLAEAHAKYREMEKIVGGRSVRDPGLMDMVEQARADQDKIYAILLRAVEQQVAPPANTADAPVTAETPVAQAPANPAPTAPYPPALDPLKSSGAETAPTSAPAPVVVAPALSTAPEATSQAVVSTQPTSEQTVGFVPSITQVDDAAVGASIQRAVDYLLTHFKDGEVVEGEIGTAGQHAGVDALCVYALLQTSRTSNDPRLNIKGEFMPKMLEKLKAMPMQAGQDLAAPVTYARSFRAAALAVYDRPEDVKPLNADVQWLIAAAVDGAYTYDDRYSHEKRYNVETPRPRSMNDLPADDSGARIILCDGIHDPKTGAEIRPPSHSNDIPSRRNNNIDTKPRDYPRTPGRGGYPATPGGPGYPGGATMPPGGIYLPPTTPTNPNPGPVFDRALPEAFVPPKEYPIDFPWDNSNSQYGLYGVWAGAETGIEVPKAYWTAVEGHWTKWQGIDGQWGYSRSETKGRFSMTLAGIASLFVTHDYLDAPALGGKHGLSRDPYGKALQVGLDWLETGDNSVDVLSGPIFYLGYNLFGLERVALASGMKHLGAHDWYAELTARVLPSQLPSGAFGRGKGGRDDPIDTAYVLLFLVRGRPPVMMNKLRFNDFWTNRPRDIANLASHVSRELERPINWQVVDLLRDPSEWADSPILYVASHHDINFTDAELAKLRAFVDGGGILFTHADQASDEFNKYAAQIAKKMFPNYEMKDLAPDDPIYSVHKTLKTPHPKLRAVSNGARLLMVHSPVDLSNAWQMRSEKSRHDAYELGINLYVYATGKEQFRNRLDSTAVPEPPPNAAKTIRMARLKYSGNWDPEPGAWPRFARRFQWETGVKLDIAAVDFKDLDASKFFLAHLTGIEAFAPTDEQKLAMKNYVEAGGTLLIDTVGGSGPFVDAAESTWLPATFTGAKLAALDPADPLLKPSQPGMADLSKPKLRLYAIEKIGNNGMRLKSLQAGKGTVIFSSLDVTSGLLGTSTWGILGFAPDYSEALAKNIVLQHAQ